MARGYLLTKKTILESPVFGSLRGHQQLLASFWLHLQLLQQLRLLGFFSNCLRSMPMPLTRPRELAPSCY